jgi:hypothetical protein
LNNSKPLIVKGSNIVKVSSVGEELKKKESSIHNKPSVSKKKSQGQSNKFKRDI